MTVTLATSKIVDQAMAELELDPISSFADTSALAIDVAKKYPGALDFCLEAEDWSFASTVADLPVATPGEPPADDLSLTYLYTLPGDCVRVREVLDTSAAWRVDGRILRADQDGGLKIRYTRRIENEAKLPDSFAEVVALRLAIKLSPRWLQSRAKRGDLYNLSKDALAEAKTADRTVSSGRRWDGGDMVSDWVDEALR